MYPTSTYPIPTCYLSNATFIMSKYPIQPYLPSRFLVLHGMPGSGKSVLAAETVRDPGLAVQQFHGGIFWVKVS